MKTNIIRAIFNIKCTCIYNYLISCRRHDVHCYVFIYQSLLIENINFFIDILHQCHIENSSSQNQIY